MSTPNAATPTSPAVGGGRIRPRDRDAIINSLRAGVVPRTGQQHIQVGRVQKLLAFNDEHAQRVEVVILSRNDPVSGMRVFRSAQAYGMSIQRGVFTRGGSPWRYLKPLAANLFLSANEADVRSALAAGVPAARVYPHSARASDAHPDQVRIAFDGDAVLFSDEAERVYQRGGLDAFQAHERAQAATPLTGNYCVQTESMGI